METQEQISQKAVGRSYVPGQGMPRQLDRQRARENQVSRKDDKAENLKVGIHDIDSAIMYYFKEVIRPRATVGSEEIEVPVIYANPERWQAVQKDGIYRDKEGKRQMPVIVLKRDNLERNRNITTKLDANRPHNFYVTGTTYTARNQYSRFNLLNGRVPEKTYVYSVVPDYVRINYSCIILTDYITQMNPIIEAINFASESYWGDQNRFKFQSFIDSFRTDIVAPIEGDRYIKTTFSVKLNGYILPDTVNSNPYVNLKRSGITHTKVSTVVEEVIQGPLGI